MGKSQDRRNRKLAYRRTCAGALDHIGILFSSVKSPNRSSAAAWKVASTSTSAPFTFFASFFFSGAGAGAGAAVVVEVVVLVLVLTGGAGAGDEVRDGSAEAETRMSFPWTSTSATGNSLNLTSRDAGRDFFARAKREEMDGFEASCSEPRDHSYYINMKMVDGGAVLSVTLTEPRQYQVKANRT